MSLSIIWNKINICNTTENKQQYFKNLSFIKAITSETYHDIVKLNIIDDESTFFNQDGTVSHQVLDYMQTVNSDIYNINSFILILPELNWNKKSQSYFYGFDIALKLRTVYKISTPIIFCSSYPIDFIKRNAHGVNALKYEILEHPEHYFVNLFSSNYDGLTINTMRLLTENHILDIHDTCIDLSHFITSLFHDIQNFLKPNKTKKEVSRIINKQFNRLKNIISESEYNQIKLLLNEFTNKYEAYTTEKIIRSSRKKVENEIITLINPHIVETTQTDTNSFYEKNWRVLYIDDNADDLLRVKKLFAKNGIYCCTANSGKEGFKILDYDYSDNKLFYNDLTDHAVMELKNEDISNNTLGFIKKHSNTCIDDLAKFEKKLRIHIADNIDTNLLNEKESIIDRKLLSIRKHILWPTNSITIVVVDWLFKNNEKRSYEQGHFIINHIVEHKSNLVEFIILSGVEERLQKRLINYRQLIYTNPVIIAKSNYTSILQATIYKGNKLYEDTILQISGAWNRTNSRYKKTYKEYYRMLRMSKYFDYSQVKNEIETKAEEYIETARDV